jgi:hypothetical protein
MVKPVDEREVPLVPDDAPATKGRKLVDALVPMHEAEKSAPAYEKLDFPEILITFNFTYEETEDPRELFFLLLPIRNCKRSLSTRIAV